MLSRTIAIWRPFAEPGRYGRVVLNRLAILDNQRASAVDRKVSVRLTMLLMLQSGRALRMHNTSIQSCALHLCLLVMKGGRLEKPARLRSTHSENLHSAE